MLREFFSSVSLYDVVANHEMPNYSGGFELVGPAAKPAAAKA